MVERVDVVFGVEALGFVGCEEVIIIQFHGELKKEGHCPDKAKDRCRSDHGIRFATDISCPYAKNTGYSLTHASQ